MQWIRSHMSFANLVSLMALFIALGGTTYAAVALPKNSVGAKQIKKNAVAASEIKKNAVRAAEVKSNAVGASELRSNAVASGDIADNGVAGADIADNAVGAGELIDNSVGTGDVTDGSLLAGDFAANQLTPQAYARVQADGSLELGAPPPLAVAQQKGVDQTDIQKAGAGTYCFGGLDKPIANALVSMDNAGAAATTTEVISVAIQRGNNLNGCDADHQQARVVITDVSPALAAPAAVDGRFDIWFIY
jgi:hypothetical protein